MTIVGVQTGVEGAVFLSQGNHAGTCSATAAELYRGVTLNPRRIIGGASLQVESCLGAVQTDVGSALAGCCQSTQSTGY